MFCVFDCVALVLKSFHENEDRCTTSVKVAIGKRMGHGRKVSSEYERYVLHEGKTEKPGVRHRHVL